MTVTAANAVLDHLIAGMVDYAGLFPPATLSMAEAVANYASYHRGPESWALGRFVVPAGRLREFGDAAAQHLGSGPQARPWRLSALLASGGEAAHIEPFNVRWQGQVIVDAVESKASTAEEIRSLAAVTPAGEDT